MKSIKCVLIGEMGDNSQKCALFSSYTRQIVYTRNDYIPTVNEDHKIKLITKFGDVNFLLVDTSGQEELEGIRSLSYVGANIFLAIFQHNDIYSLEILSSRFFPEVRKYCKNPMIILCGIINPNFDGYSNISEKESSCIKEEVINEFVEKNKLDGYLQVDLSNLDSINELFLKASNTYLYHEKIANSIVLDDITYYIKDDFFKVIKINRPVVTIPKKISKKFKKLPVYEIDLIPFLNSSKCYELHFHKNSLVKYIKCFDWELLEQLDIPPKLEYISNEIAKSAINIKKINILSPRKNRFELNQEKFLINTINKEVILVLRNTKQTPKLIDAETIYPYAFSGNALDYDVFSTQSKIKSLPEFCFFQSTIREITIPDSCKIICKCCFLECSHLEKVNISSNCILNKIEEEAFSKSKISRIFLPKSIESLNTDCFNFCDKLELIEFDEDANFTGFETNCFGSCSKNVILKVPKCFQNLQNLPKEFLFNLDLTNNNVILIDGDCIFDKNGRRLFYVRNGNQSKLVIKEHVDEMMEGALKDIESVKEVEVIGMRKINLSDFPVSVESFILAKNVEEFVGDEYHQQIKTITIRTDDIVLLWNCENLPHDLSIIAENIENVSFRKAADKRNVISVQECDKKKLLNVVPIVNQEERVTSLVDYERKKSTLSMPEASYKNIMKRESFDFERLEKVEFIGKGQFGEVFLTRDKESGRKYAVKNIECIEDGEGKNKENYEREVSTMKKALHPCVVRIYGSSPWSSGGLAQIALEYLSHGTLSNLKELNNTEKAIIFVGICLGMEYLHSIGIIHRDLKPDNIFVDARKHVRIGDFGLSKFDQLGITNTRSIGSPIYMAPELFDEKHCGPAADVYAFGVLAFELLFDTQCFPRNISQFQLIKLKMDNSHTPIPEDATPLAQTLIDFALKTDDSQRPSFHDILAILKEMNFELLPDVDVSSVKNYISEVEVLKNNPEQDDTFCEYDFGHFSKIETVIMSEAVIDFDKFENPRFLGRGGCGTVYAMTNTDDGKEYAVKTLNNINDESSKSFVREIEILCEVAHPCTMRIIGYSFYQSEESPARIALEFCRFGTVSDIMKQIYKGDKESISLFDGTRRSMIVVGVSYGMRYLHNLGITHRDLKPQNIFLDDQLLPKIGDFGISKFSDCDSTLTKNIGTLFYSAPEVYDDQDYDNKVDVYSFGLILYELSSLSPAYPLDIKEGPLLKRKMNNDHPTAPPDACEIVRLLIDSCLSLNPSDRPSFNEIVTAIKSFNFNLFAGTDTSAVSFYSESIELFEMNHQNSG